MPQPSIASFFKKEAKTGDKRKSTSSTKEVNGQVTKIARVERVAGIEPFLELFSGLSVMHKTWFDALHGELKKKSFTKLAEFVKEQRKKGTVFPAPDNVFSWTRRPLSEIKVVILGQDPYHGPNQAHGLSFSVLPPTKPPPSLLNMFKELMQDENVDFDVKPNHGDLTKWADQGVLMLNAVLTVNQAKANSHKGQGWESLTDGAIKAISKNCVNVVFFLWGLGAKKKKSLIDTEKHLILEGVHPSPLSAHRGFFGCQHFSKANDYLKEHKKEKVKWSAIYE